MSYCTTFEQLADYHSFNKVISNVMLYKHPQKNNGLVGSFIRINYIDSDMDKGDKVTNMLMGCHKVRDALDPNEIFLISGVNIKEDGVFLNLIYFSDVCSFYDYLEDIPITSIKFTICEA